MGYEATNNCRESENSPGLGGHESIESDVLLQQEKTTMTISKNIRRLARICFKVSHDNRKLTCSFHSVHSTDT